MIGYSDFYLHVNTPGWRFRILVVQLQKEESWQISRPDFRRGWRDPLQAGNSFKG
jgi:hypothetical protein